MKRQRQGERRKGGSERAKLHLFAIVQESIVMSETTASVALAITVERVCCQEIPSNVKCVVPFCRKTSCNTETETETGTGTATATEADLQHNKVAGRGDIGAGGCARVGSWWPRPSGRLKVEHACSVLQSQKKTLSGATG